MSNIYIQEPPTSGKVLLKTTVGDLELELWTREAPKACKNFIQLCMEGYYNGTIFHRVVKGFIVQGGDPTGTGEGGESVYGGPFKDEFHTRLRFCRRGLLAMANTGKDDNGSQFFFTLAATPELQNKHTIFGKVTGETIYNMLKLEETEVDQNERPLYPQKIIKSEILLNPFEDIVPRIQLDVEPVKAKKPKEFGVKNFKLLSFGEEAEEDEEESVVINKKFSGKSKSAHDNLSDPKLSAEVAVENSGRSGRKKSKREDRSSDWESDEAEMTEEQRMESKKKAEEMKRRIIDKLHDTTGSKDKKRKIKEIHYDEAKDRESSEEEYYIGKERHDERKKQAEAIRKEIRDLKRDVHKEKKEKESNAKAQQQEQEKKTKADELLNEYTKSHEDYKKAASVVPRKGTSRESLALERLKKFKTTLKSMNERTPESVEPVNDNKEKAEDSDDDDSWKVHTFQCEDKNPILAKDASTKDDDWFEIYDPRNPLNKRRRGELPKKSQNDSGGNRSHSRYK